MSNTWHTHTHTHTHTHHNHNRYACAYKEPRIHTRTHMLTLSLSLFSFSSPGTIGVSKCQSSIWIAAVITVKAGHQRDARLTLLTCLHQHIWTASLAEQQFSHGASQNKVHCSHTLHWPKKLSSSTHNAYLLYPHREHKNNMLFSWNQKTPESRWKPLFPIDFTC